MIPQKGKIWVRGNTTLKRVKGRFLSTIPCKMGLEKTSLEEDRVIGGPPVFIGLMEIMEIYTQGVIWSRK